MPNDGILHNGDAAFKAFFEAYRNRVYGYVLAICHSHYIAEELTQELFIKLWLSRDMLHEIKIPDSYIFTMARNKTLNHLRKVAHNNKLLGELKNIVTQPESNTENRMLEADYEKILQEALTRLSPQRRLVYQLSRAQGLNHEQIATHLQLSNNTVKNHLVEALRFIRTYFKGKGATAIFIIMFLT